MYVDDLYTDFSLENKYPIFEKNDDYLNINTFNQHFPNENIINNNSFSSENSDLLKNESEINNIENISTNINTNNLIQSNISMEIIESKKKGRKKKVINQKGNMINIVLIMKYINLKLNFIKFI